MSDLFWLTDEQMARLRPFFPKSHGKPRADDRRVLSGIVFVNRNGLRWRDAPSAYGPHKTLYNLWKRWGAMGVFVRMMEGLAGADAEPRTVMIDATYLKAHRTASSLRVKGGLGRLIGRTKGGMNTKLHALADANGRPLSFFMTAGQVSDYTGRRRCWTTYQRRSGCSAIAATTPIGSGTLYRPRAFSPASRVGDPATSPSGMTGAATGHFLAVINES